MANVKITDLGAYTDPASTDVLPIVDVGADVTKKVSIENLLKNASSGTAAAPGIAFDGDSNTGLYSPGADQVAISTNGTGRLFIDSSGNAGFGTSSPGSPLEIVGDYSSGPGGHGTLNITSNDTGNNGQDARSSIGFSAPFASSGDVRVLYGLIEGKKENAIQGVTQGFLAFSTSPILSTGPVERMRINSVGNVGIGTTNPGAALHVNGNIRADGIYGETDTNTSIQFPGSDVITFNEGGSEAARIDGSGRLLVGTSTSRVTGATQVISQIETTDSTAGLAITRNSDDEGPGRLVFSKSRGTVNGSSTIVTENTEIGAIDFAGADGTDLISRVAIIAAAVDGTPGANDMPGRLVFSVTADGSALPAEAMRIKNTRVINFSNTPVYADNAAAKTGGLANGDVYRTSTGDLKIVYT